MDTQPPPRIPAAERSLGELFRDLASETSDLVRQEMRLARTELRQNVRQLGKDAAGLAIGGGVAAVGGLVLVAFLVAGLGELLGDNYWLSALLVGAAMAGAGVWLAMRALRDMKGVSLAPEETLSTLRGTGSWASAEAAELRAALAVGNGSDGRGRPVPAALGPGPVPTNRLRGVAALPPAATAAPSPPPAGGASAARGSDAGEEDDPGLKGLLKRVFREIRDDEIPGQAAKVAYYAFMALPPAVMALFGLAGLFGSLDLARTIERQAQLALPAAVTETIVTPFIEQVVLDKAPGPFSIGLLLALWGASSLFTGLMATLNKAYDVEEDRSFVKKRAMALGVMLAGAFLFLLAAGAILGGPQISGALGLGEVGNVVWGILQWPLAFAGMVGAFWLVYYVLPNRDQRACRKVLLKAAAAAALLWVVATAAFRIYIANFSSYSETYGFIGAFIILLLWFYVTGLVVLAGGELASEMERRPR